jgi:cytochrome P450
MIKSKELKEPDIFSGEHFNTNIKEINNNPLNFYAKIKEINGDYIKCKILPGFYMYALFHPDAVQHVLQSTNYRKPDFFYNAVRPLTGYGLFTSEGNTWLKQRRISQPAFLKKNVEKLSSILIKSIREELNNWDSFNDNEVIDISSKMITLTIKVLSNALFSLDISDESNELSVALRSAFEFVSKKMSNPMSLPIWIPTKTNKKFINDKKIIDSIVDKIIKTRRESKENYNDLLDTLINSKDNETGDMLNDNQLRDQMITMVVAGHDTTSAALSWAFYLLAKNKDKENILLNEIDSIVSNSDIDLKALEKMEYSKMVFEETMRLYPPAWGLPREAINDDSIGSYIIKKKIPISLSQYITHRHSDFWERPLDFYPEHFTKESVENRHKFAYFPFGAGSRMCIGKIFAMLEAQLILIHIMQRFTFDLINNDEVIPDPTFTLIAKGGIKLRIKKRK